MNEIEKVVDIVFSKRVTVKWLWLTLEEYNVNSPKDCRLTKEEHELLQEWYKKYKK